MGLKVTAVLVVTFLITMLVLIGHPRPITASTIHQTVVPSAAPTRIVLVVPTAAPTEAVAPTRIVFSVPTAVPTTVPTEAPTDVVAPTTVPAIELTAAAHAALAGDAAHGEDIFRNGLDGAPPCITCHSPTTAGRGTFSIGPGLMGIHERAASRVEGETAVQYIEHSIRHPADFLVPGFNPVMPGIFGEHYSDQDIADLVAFLMSL